MPRTIDLGRTTIVVHADSSGYPVKAPKWAGDNEVRVLTPEPITLTRDTIGWVLRLGDKPLVSINEGNLEALGLALIRASVR